MCVHVCARVCELTRAAAPPAQIAPRVLSTSVHFPGGASADTGAEAGAASGGAYWNSSARVVEWQARVRSRPLAAAAGDCVLA